MANTNAPFGFRPIKSLSGGEVEVSYMSVASSASRIGKGDLVELASDGTIVRSAAAAEAGPFIGVSLADTGVITAAITNHPVCTDPNAIYEVQASSAALAITDIGTIVYAKCDDAPNSSTGLSKNVLTATPATASDGVRIMRFVPAADNAIGASARVEVKLNALQATPNSAGV